MNKISIKGLVIGSIINMIIMGLLAPPIIHFAVHAIMHPDTTPINRVISEAIESGQQHPFSSFLLGSIGFMVIALSSFPSGYVAAYIAKHDQVLNGGLASALFVGSCLYIQIQSSSQSPLWELLLSISTSIAFAAFGGYLRLRQVRAQSRPA